MSLAVIVGVAGIALDDGLILQQRRRTCGADSRRGRVQRGPGHHDRRPRPSEPDLPRRRERRRPRIACPGPREVPRLLGGDPVELSGYPLPMVHAEKIVTALQRGTVNTRWRDFADVWTLSGTHPARDELQTALRAVADYRGVALARLQDALEGYPALAQGKWAAWRRKQQMLRLPSSSTTSSRPSSRSPTPP